MQGTHRYTLKIIDEAGREMTGVVYLDTLQHPQDEYTIKRKVVELYRDAMYALGTWNPKRPWTPPTL